MRRDLRRSALGLACAGLLLAAAPAFAQNASSFGSSGGFNSTSIGGGGSSSSFGSSGGGAFGGSSSSGMGGNSAFGGTSGGNSVFGGTSGTSTTTGRGGTTQVGSSSFLGASYANPLALGLTTGSGTTTSTAFGTALYNLNTSRTGTATVSTSSSNQNSQFGAGYNIRRLPGYATTLKIKGLPPPPTGAQVRTDLQTMIAQSPEVDPRDSVRIVIDGSAVVLQGQVVDDDERRLIENMVRLTPNVYQVRNELTTKQ